MNPLEETTPLLEPSKKRISQLDKRPLLYLSTILILSVLSLITYTLHSNTNQSILNAFLPLPLTPGQHQQTFSIKHIYHHNTRLNPQRRNQSAVHKRLDITPQFIHDHSLDLHYEKLSNVSASFADVSPWLVSLPFKSETSTMLRLVDRDPDMIESYLNFASERTTEELTKLQLDWHEEPVVQPNTTDRDTILALALMSSNAYVDVPDTGDWRDVGWNKTYGHGWNETGLRGYVFISDDESQVVVSFKGTSGAYISGGAGETVEQDRDNDNLLFSCCCARVSYLWTPVCDCFEGGSTCDQRCIERELYNKDRYFAAASNIYRNVTNMYPNASIWVTGHSLGGALSALIGRAYGVPAVSFEAPGEAMAAKRLHLPFPPGLPEYSEMVWQFGHTADPIFMGTCNGSGSSCFVAGYAMESQCHSGKQCVYDPVTDLGWHVNIMNHRIHTVIDDVILAYNETAKCVKSPPCKDCYNWNFIDGDKKKKKPTDTETITTTASLIHDPEPTSPDGKCKKWNWYGKCIQY